MLILRPKVHTPIYHRTPFFYLAGPILGGGDWHTRACQYLAEKVVDPLIDVPTRWPDDHPLSDYFLQKRPLEETQLEWERRYMKNATNHQAMHRCLVFWIPREDPQNPRNDGSPYARDTYGELGEWRGRLIHDTNLPIVVGIEPGFPGRDVIKRNFEYALEGLISPTRFLYEFSISDTLEDTLDAAISRAGYTTPAAT